MKRLPAWSALSLTLAFTTLALTGPLACAGGLLVLGLTATRRRRALLALGLASMMVDLLLFGLFGPGPTLAVIPFPLHPLGLAIGATAALRLTAVAAVNLGALALLPAERLLEGLGLPPGATATLAAVALCARDVARDAQRMVDAARLDGAWPSGRWARVRTGAGLLPPLLVASVRRAETRREALRLAGIDFAPSWTPVVAVGALAIAGRFALLALPNVAFTYVIVFLGGILFGKRVGILAGLLGMALSDLLLTGLQPTPFVNAPAMALLGLLGGALRGLDWSSRRPGHAWANRVLAGAIGVAATMLFSLASDGLTWALVPEYRGQPGALRLLVAAGFAFNVLPAIANAVLFAAATAPTVRAWQAVGSITPDGAARPAPGRPQLVEA